MGGGVIFFRLAGGVVLGHAPLLAAARRHLHRFIDAEHGLGMLKGFKFPSEIVELGEGHGGAAFLIGEMQAYVPERLRFQWQNRSGER